MLRTSFGYLLSISFLKLKSKVKYRIELEKLVESKRKNYFLGLYDSKSIVYSNKSVNWDFIGLFEKINFIKSFGFFEVVKFLTWISNLTKDFKRFINLFFYEFLSLNI